MSITDIPSLILTRIIESPDVIWTDVVSSNNDPNHIYLVDQKGTILKFQLASWKTSLVMDIRFVINKLFATKPLKSRANKDERGLLSMCFDKINNKIFYIAYNTVSKTIGNDNDLVISKFKIQGTPAATLLTGIELLRIKQPEANHSGGCIRISSDNMMYISVGDGGGSGGNELLGNAQNLKTMLGKILRYKITEKLLIPAGFKINNKTSSIFALGFRNPWRFDIYNDSPKDPSLIVGDVGQDNWEKISIVKFGENHGWRGYEGFEIFRKPVVNYFNKNNIKITMPKLVYPHSKNAKNIRKSSGENIKQFNGLAIIGGTIYKGDEMSKYKGYYIFGDYNGSILVSKPTNTKKWRFKKVGSIRNVDRKAYLHSFGTNPQGEIYAIGNFGIYRISQIKKRIFEQMQSKQIKKNCFKLDTTRKGGYNKSRIGGQRNSSVFSGPDIYYEGRERFDDDGPENYSNGKDFDIDQNLTPDDAESSIFDLSEDTDQWEISDTSEHIKNEQDVENIVTDGFANFEIP